jgi:hypothetical protein
MTRRNERAANAQGETMIRHTNVAAAFAALLAACGGTAAGAHPDDMSAAEHARAGERHEARSDSHAAQYDPSARDVREGRILVERQGSEVDTSRWNIQTYNPTAFHHEEAARHHEHAEQHRAAADALRAFEEGACSAFPAETRATCPLFAEVTEVRDVQGGALVRFAATVPIEAVADHMRCHFAFARARGYADAPACPLHMPALDVAVEGGAVRVTTTDAAAVATLRSRIRAHQGP